MTGKRKCGACGSERVIPDVTIFDQNQLVSGGTDLTIHLHAKPGALFFKGTKKAVLHATICGDCGQVDLRVKNPGRLYDFYEKRRK